MGQFRAMSFCKDYNQCTKKPSYVGKKLSNVRGIRSITFTSRVKSIGKRILLTADWLNSGGAVLFECMNLIPHKTNAKN